jgi:hypothetical protein
MAKSTYTTVIATSICEQLIEGKSLRQICEQPGMPNKATVLRWLADEKRAVFRDQYARAREMQAEAMADEILEIADTPEIGQKTVSKATGIEITEGDMIEHRRLRVDTRKWLMSKLLPKKYGVAKEEESDSGDVTIHGGLPE